ncbi:Peptidase family M23 [Marininema mesophilum]|uniref:Peptidase family M23 n=1 Tax=Marininema mesophilum TaxID=1048340 RepID=A0A1H3CG30_9BACL|nr:M23 family metallopeptidase [Marininema mesophilum]SDX52980.1 Peptidase family M23 [Marininema mesophilum]
MRKKILTWLIICTLFTGLIPSATYGESKHATKKNIIERQRLLEKMETLTGIPWVYLAAIDQYERNVQRSRRDFHQSNGLISITIPSDKWCGTLNPDQKDTTPASIHFFGGMGMDGDGDKKADSQNPLDILYSMTHYLRERGVTRDDIRIGLWDYYQHPVAVDVITHLAKIYTVFHTIKLNERSFIMPLRSKYTYHDTWGDRRGFGGLRIHEGTDIFADYGTPVLSTSYGYVELMGWNRFGGWRMGIRDGQNNYHYYAHLSSFKKGIKQGSVVKPGDVLGYVGSSGYGPPGTSGKFPPHLHYGMYKFNGRNTFSFDPYPYLKVWERKAWRKLHARQRHRRSHG